MSFTRLALPAALIAMSLGAHAAPALSTIDADVLDTSRCQSDTRFQRNEYKLNGFDSHSSDYGTAFSCGLGLNSQLGLEIRRMSADGFKMNQQSLQGRTRLGRIGDSGPQLTLLWGLERRDFNILGANDFKATTASRLGLAVSQDLGAGRVYGSISHTGFMESGKLSEWKAGYQHRLNDALQLHYEVSGASDQKPTHAIGVAWNVTPSAQLGLDLATHRMGNDVSARSAMVTARFGF